jgi:hypothetical protein
MACARSSSGLADQGVAADSDRELPVDVVRRVFTEDADGHEEALVLQFASGADRVVCRRDRAGDRRELPSVLDLVAGRQLRVDCAVAPC